MSNVLISIKPEWVAKICSGKKTIEVRKTKPKMDTPFKVYIYCSKGKDLFNNSGTATTNGEYIACEQTPYMYKMNGKVVAEFTCDKIEGINSVIEPYRCAYGYDVYYVCDTLDIYESCVSTSEMLRYLGLRKGYAWHISDLKVYDNPKDLSDFKSLQRVIDPFRDYFTELPIKKPPQSWQYVEE